MACLGAGAVVWCVSSLLVVLGKAAGGAAAGIERGGPQVLLLTMPPLPPACLPACQVLEPSPVRDLKAVAVVAMLERLVGPEAFQKLLQRMVEAGAGKARDAAARCISTRKFVKAVSGRGAVCWGDGTACCEV